MANTITAEDRHGMTDDERLDLIDAISEVINQRIAQNLEGVIARLASVEARPSIPGPPGERGPVGEKGDKGERGETGMAGADGKDGERGERGLPGERGEAGERGERGEAGVPGEKGERGLAGERGERGEAGERGLIGERGDKGADGRDGRDAKDGRDGKDGEPGRDALQIDVIEAEEGKAYARGTFATYRGGLVRVDGNHDIQTIVRGIDSLNIIQAEDLRSFTVQCTLTDGQKVEKQFATPTLLYRGIYRTGETYVRGDCVTQAGSTWHCNAESTQVAPSTPNSKDWQLMVKRGADGKDLRPKDDTPPGPIHLK